MLEVLRRATGYLGAHGSSSPRLDAELLLACALGVRRLDLYLQFERRLAEPELARYRELVAARGRGEPVAYLVGVKEFMNLEFAVTPAVLIPNPDTEVLVIRAVDWCRARPGEVRVADVGTGSGCIAAAVAHYVPEARVWAGDDDPAALRVAAGNLDRLGLAGRVELVEGDLLEPFPPALDLVCANLPYVGEAAGLPAEVLAQPGHALFAPGGGLDLVRRLLDEAPARLAATGCVMVEIDPGLVGRLDLSGYAGHRTHRDLAGRERVIEAWL